MFDSPTGLQLPPGLPAVGLLCMTEYQEGLLPDSRFSDPEPTTATPLLPCLDSPPPHMHIGSEAALALLSLSHSLEDISPKFLFEAWADRADQYPEEKESRTRVYPRSDDGGLTRCRGKVRVWTVCSFCSALGWHLSPPLPNGYPDDGVARPRMTNRIAGSQGC